MGNGKVSVIVPCYKQADYLPETLDSVLAQTYSNWECVIVNDGSPDNTDEVVDRYLTQDFRFKYIKQQNSGPSVARNTGIENSCGEFILPLDADDLIAPTYLEKAVEVFNKDENTKLVYCKADKFGLVNKPWVLEEYNYDRFIWDNSIFCTAMFKRSDYIKTGGYNVNMTRGLEDWDFYLSLLKKDDVVHCLNETLFHYRIKELSRTTEMLKQSQRDMLIQIYNNHADIYEPFKERLIIYYRESQKVQQLKASLDAVHSSHAYRLGKLLLKPFSWLRKK